MGPCNIRIASLPLSCRLLSHTGNVCFVSLAA